MAAHLPPVADLTVAQCAAELRGLLAASYPESGPLRPGASAAELDTCEAAIGRPLPPQLRELLAAADGQDYGAARTAEFPGAPWSRLLSCADVGSMYEQLDTIVSMCEEEFGCEAPGDYRVAADHRAMRDGAPAVALNAAWVPFAVGDHGGGGPPLVFMVDEDPAPGAAPGRVLAFGCDDALSLWAPDVRSLLADVVAVLRRRAAAAAAAAAAAPPGAAGGAPDVAARHRKVLYDDGPRVWHQYFEGDA